MEKQDHDLYLTLVLTSIIFQRCTIFCFINLSVSDFGAKGSKYCDKIAIVPFNTNALLLLISGTDCDTNYQTIILKLIKCGGREAYGTIKTWYATPLLYPKFYPIDR